MTVHPSTVETTRPPFWRDLRVLRAFAQVAAVAGAIFLFRWILGNVTTNLESVGIRTDFGFLNGPAGFQVANSDFEPAQPVSDVILVGVRNTFALAILGIPLLTIFGVLVGVARLSPNWLVSKAATTYVETLRNIPPLLVILFTNALILLLPRIQEAATPFGWFVISNRSISVPWIANGSGAGTYWMVLAGALLGAVGIWVWRTRRSDATGEPHHRVLWSGLFFIGVAVVAYLLLDDPIALSRPELEGLVVTGGFLTLANYVTVLIALSLYTASHVAEIVRGSIQAVAKGQVEAANALALGSFQRLRFVILPQAFRIALPPIINQYLNFVKNSSLALAIGYAEVTTIMFQVIGNGNPAPQSIVLLMAVYLTFSLVISLIVNYVNRRIQYVVN